MKNFESIICHEEEISCSIETWSTSELTFTYTLPDELDFSEYEITIESGTEKDISNNTVTTEIGFADLSVENVTCYVTDNGKAKVKGTIKNNGYTSSENTVISYYTQDDIQNAFATDNFGTIEPGEQKDFYFELSETVLMSNGYTFNSLNIILKSDTSKLDYGNNEEKLIIDEILKAIPHNYCRADAQSDFLPDCIKILQAYWRMSKDFCVI